MSGDWAGMVALAMDYPSPQRDRANPSRDAPTLRSSRRGDPRSERSGSSANSPSGPATGAGANVSAALGSQLDGHRRPHFRLSQARWSISVSTGNVEAL
jgi:hypothetical protein